MKLFSRSIQLVIAGALLIAPKTAFAAKDIGLDKAAGCTTPGSADCNFQGEITVIVGRIIEYGLAMVGVVFLVLIIYGGVLWMTAQGDEKKVGNARGYIFHSILGFILVMAAYSITHFVVDALANAALTQ